MSAERILKMDMDVRVKILANLIRQHGSLTGIIAAIGGRAGLEACGFDTVEIDRILKPAELLPTSHGSADKIREDN